MSRAPLVAILPLILLAARAHAADPAAAEAVFEEGKRSVARGDLDKGCRAFEESQRLDPGMGTLYHLADCEERRGKTATAWARFRELAAQAKAQGEEAREKAARDR